MSIAPTQMKLPSLTRTALLALSLGSTGGLLAQDAEFIGIIKIQNFRQVSPNIVTLLDDDYDDADQAPFVFDAFADASSPDFLTSGSVNRPVGADVPMMLDGDGQELNHIEGFELLAELNDAFGAGSYTMDLVGANDPPRSVTLDLSGDTYPGLARFSNFTAAQSINASSDFTFEWDEIPNATDGDLLIVFIDSESGGELYESPDLGESGALDGDSTSVTVPGGTLNPGTDYTIVLEVFKAVDTNEDYAAGVLAISAYGKTTSMPIRTAGGSDSSPPNFNRSVPYVNEELVELNTVVTFVFDEPMDESVVVSDAITWTGLPNPASFSYLWSPDGKILFCDYTAGLPLSTLVQWELNPSGSTAKLRDAATNNLPEGHFGEFTTNSTGIMLSDVKTFELIKGRSFFQDGAVPIDLESYFGEFFLQMNGYNTVSSVDLGIPGGAVETFASGDEFGGNEIEAEADYAEKADLDQIFPNGDYVVTMNTFHDGEKEVTLSIGPDDYPNAPTIQNFATTQAVDSSQPFTLEWAAMAGGDSDDFVGLFIEGETACYFETPEPGEPGALDGTAISVIIPADSLPPGRTIEGELVFAEIIDKDIASYPGAKGLTAFVTITEFEIQTTGDPIQPKLEIQVTGTQVMITVIGEIGIQYELQVSDDLENWSQMATRYVFGDDCDGFMGSFQDFDDASWNTKRFYQVGEVPSSP